MAKKSTVHNLQQLMAAHVKKHQLFQKGDLVMVAVSGGLDSVVLLDVLKRVHEKLMVLHVNFNLRGDESKRDELFVSRLADQYGLPLSSIQFDTAALAKTAGMGIQEMARKLRYDWFDESCLVHKPADGKALTATAHHANDVAETMLNNLFRGGGLKSLSGIPVCRGNIIRPLLFAEKEQLKAYAEQHQLQWVEDSSNEKEDYTRNFIRKKILPIASEIYPQTVANMLLTAERLRQAESLYRHAIAEKLKKITETDKDGTMRMSALKLLKSEPLETLIYECFQAFGFTSAQVPEIIKLCEAGSGAYMESTSHRLVKHAKWLYVLPVAPAISVSPILVSGFPAEITMGVQKLQVAKVVGFPSLAEMKKGAPDTEYVDATALVFPLVVRKLKAGDYFYPLGMKKKKKVARFLIDEKIPAHKKEAVWVVESNGRIVWVIGYRLDDRFALTKKTSAVLSFTMSR